MHKKAENSKSMNNSHPQESKFHMFFLTNDYGKYDDDNTNRNRLPISVLLIIYSLGNFFKHIFPFYVDVF